MFDRCQYCAQPTSTGGCITSGCPGRPMPMPSATIEIREDSYERAIEAAYQRGHADGLRDGAAKERGKAVAFINRHHRFASLHDIADAISRGEHEKGARHPADKHGNCTECGGRSHEGAC